MYRKPLTIDGTLGRLEETDLATRLETAIAANRQSGSDRHRGRQKAHLRYGRQSFHTRRGEGGKDSTLHVAKAIADYAAN